MKSIRNLISLTKDGDMKTFTKTLFAGIAASAMIAGAATTAAVAMDYKGKTVRSSFLTAGRHV